MTENVEAAKQRMLNVPKSGGFQDTKPTDFQVIANSLVRDSELLRLLILRADDYNQQYPESGKVDLQALLADAYRKYSTSGGKL